MRAREILFEMPYLMAGSVDWGLQDAKRNRRRAGLILNTPHVILRGDEFGTLYKRDRATGGDFAYIDVDTKLIAYFMEFTKTRRADLGTSATQVKVWATISPGTIGLAGEVFFDIMPAEYNTMISDRIHTEDGRQFWLRRMAEARRKGLRVGLLDHGSLIGFDQTTNFQNWLDEIDGWSRRSEHYERLFLISKQPLTTVTKGKIAVAKEGVS